MKWIQSCQKYLIKNRAYQRWLMVVFVGLLTLVITLNIHILVDAAQPSAVLIINSYSFRNRGLGVRRQEREPPETVSNSKTVLNDPRDVLIVEGDNSSWAELAHLLSQKPLKPGEFIMKTLKYSTPSEYWFSCRAKGNYLMAWRQGGIDRPCGEGLQLINRHTGAVKSSSNLNYSKIAQANKSIVGAQTSNDGNDSITIIPGSKQTILQTFDSEIGIIIEVIEGDIRVISTKVPEGKLVKKGERYTYPQNNIVSIELDSIVQKPEVKDFLDPEKWSPPNVPQVIADAIKVQLTEAKIALGLGSQAVNECHGKEILIAKACVGDGLEPEEEKLAKLINQYRVQNRLSSIPVSKSLTLVANRHVRDMDENIHNLSHSWSNCPYIEETQSTWPCMWEAPQRLKTAYPGNGYENAYGGSGVASAEGALQSWQDKSYHQEVILNQNIWKSSKWNALGVGIYKGYAVMWVGEVVDPA